MEMQIIGVISWECSFWDVGVKTSRGSGGSLVWLGLRVVICQVLGVAVGGLGISGAGSRGYTLGSPLGKLLEVEGSCFFSGFSVPAVDRKCSVSYRGI